jgi:hypothetical protein
MTEAEYRMMMHRVYRAMRGLVARDLSPFHPTFPDELHQRFKEKVGYLKLRQPKEQKQL